MPRFGFGLLMALLVWSNSHAAPIVLLPFEDYECLGADCPINFTSPSGSGTSASGDMPRSRSEGAFLQTKESEATVGTEFQVCDPVSARLVVRGVFQGLLRGTGGGIINRGRVRGSLVLRDQTTGETLVQQTITEREERGKPAQTINTIISELTDFDDFDPGTVVTEDLEAEHVYMLGYRLSTLASGSNALADFNQGAPPRFGRLLEMKVELTPDLPDSDGDGLYDVWETDGVKDCEGNVLVNLKALGADVNHKDIFVEYDWVDGAEPSKDSIDRLKQIFAAAPVDNPDGDTGIRLWIDTGTLSEAGQLVGDNFGGGNEIAPGNIPNGAFVPRLKEDGDGDGVADFFEVRALEFNPDRRAVFHYAISGPSGPGEDPMIGRDSCDDGLDNDADGLSDGDDIVDCFSGGQGGGGNFFVSNAGTSTFLHELGHSLGLGHGGRDAENDMADAGNCKPNYLSIMNYSFSGGVPADLDGDGVFESKTLDFAPLDGGDGRVNSPLGDLIEDQLVETEPLDPNDSLHATRYVDGTGTGRTSAADEPIDWNGENGIEDGTVVANINRGDEDGDPAACEADSSSAGHPADETLISRSDWNSLRYRFPVRADFDSRGPDIVPEPPIGPEEVDRVFFASDLAIEKTVDPDPWVAGQTVRYELAVTNHGPNGVPEVEVLETPPAGVVFSDPPQGCTPGEDGTLRCALPPLPVGETTTIALDARLPVIRDCGRSQFVHLSNSAEVINVRGRELVPANNRATVRHRVLCPMFEYAAKFVCGRQTDPERFALLAGRYGSIVNIHNPQYEEVFAFVKLALALPPGRLQPGEISPLDLVALDYDEAAAAGCDYVREKVFGEGPQPELIDGFLVIQSARSLDVTGVYTRQALDYVTGEGSIDIERVPERKFSPPQPKPDLRPEILATDLVCGSAITCKLSLRYLVENIGDAAAGPFATRLVSQPAATTLGQDDWPLGLAPQTSEIRSFNIGIVQTQLGEQICVEADLPANAVEEVDEENNVTCIDLP